MMWVWVYLAACFVFCLGYILCGILTRSKQRDDCMGIHYEILQALKRNKGEDSKGNEVGKTSENGRVNTVRSTNKHDQENLR